MALVVDGFRDVGAVVLLLAAVLLLALMGLIMLGLGVHALSKFVGMPVPTVHDDPNRTEWNGLALDALYGCIGAAALFACYAVGRRLLPATARDHVGKVLACLALAAVALVGGVYAVNEWDVQAGVVAIAAGVGAWRVARGASLFGEEHSPLPASFDTPPKVGNDELTPRAKTWTPSPRRPFAFPASGEPRSNPLADAEPIRGADDQPT